MTKPILSAAETMADVARRAMDQGQEAIRLGFTTMTSANAPIAERGYAQSRRAVEETARVLAAYERSADRIFDHGEALLHAYLQLGRSAQKWPLLGANMVQQTMERFGEKPRDLFRCGSLVEAARLQGEICVNVLETMMAFNRQLLQLTSEISQEAMRSLSVRERG